MANPHKIAFVLASTAHGAMIVNRFDYKMVGADLGVGVGYALLETSAYDQADWRFGAQQLTRRRHVHGDGVVALDCGANIGVFTVEWSKHMAGWGQVIAIEAQERLYHALCGNIAINNCFNARAVHAAVGCENGVMRIPTPDYTVPGSFGSLELLQSDNNEDIGQPIDYERRVPIRELTIDSLHLPRLDLLKLDIEGMEDQALLGAMRTLQRYRPVIIAECIKAQERELRAMLAECGYDCYRDDGLNLIAIHSSDE